MTASDRSDGHVPRTGTFVVDTRWGKVGQVMGHEGPRLQLRPPRGGCEWEAAPEVVRPATDAERLSASVRVNSPRLAARPINPVVPLTWYE
ncbi:hypothetical protein [Streptomyces sp. XH2]|uniref:hypothetical protein n=1 Tax=Streptomyces sp. XH2 TaxID=3412483 RepID=UPI003C7B0481